LNAAFSKMYQAQQQAGGPQAGPQGPQGPQQGPDDQGPDEQ
jgi:hypothetical protein